MGSELQIVFPCLVEINEKTNKPVENYRYIILEYHGIFSHQR